MRRLTTQQRVSVVRCLVEGCSIRSTVRMTGVSKNAISRFLLDIGRVCLNHEDRALRGLAIQRLECDELWGFVHCKDRQVPKAKMDVPGMGSQWTWIALDADSKLIVSWLIGDRNIDHARAFIGDLRSRLVARPQISTDALGAYAGVIAESFHSLGVDYGQVHKIYGKFNTDDTRYSPSVCIGTEKKAVRGNPNMKLVSTSFVERANLTVRMSQRRWTRLTNAHSKSFSHMEAAFALHSFYYNWCRKHMTLGTTPAVAAGVAKRAWTVEEVVGLLEAEERAEIGTDARKRGPYKRHTNI